jgi:hypothetical protein
LQLLLEYLAFLGDFRNRVCVYHVCSLGQSRAELDVGADRVRFQFEMLVSEGRRPSHLVDANYNHGQIKITFRPVGGADRTIDSIVLHLRRFDPLKCQRSKNGNRKFPVDAMSRHRRVDYLDGYAGIPALVGTPEMVPLAASSAGRPAGSAVDSPYKEGYRQQLGAERDIERPR